MNEGAQDMKQKPGTAAPDIIPSATVADIGRAIFGPHWQVPLAKALKVQDQMVRRWTNDGCPAPLMKNLRTILEARATEIQRVLKVLEEFEIEK